MERGAARRGAWEGDRDAPVQVPGSDKWVLKGSASGDWCVGSRPKID